MQSILSTPQSLCHVVVRRLPVCVCSLMQSHHAQLSRVTIPQHAHPERCEPLYMSLPPHAPFSPLTLSLLIRCLPCLVCRTRPNADKLTTAIELFVIDAGWLAAGWGAATAPVRHPHHLFHPCETSGCAWNGHPCSGYADFVLPPVASGILATMLLHTIVSLCHMHTHLVPMRLV